MTEAGARRYGVVIRKGKVDAAATRALRAEMAAARGPVKLFDRGFETVEELKARCKAETGHEPPAAPQFTAWAGAKADKVTRAAARSRKAGGAA